MPLLFASAGDEVKVAAISGDAAVKQHLNEIGFNVGSRISVVQKVSTGLIVRVKDARIAIDRSMAKRIMVS